MGKTTKRNKRNREEKITPIGIDKKEYKLLVKFLNIITKQVHKHYMNSLGYKISSCEFYMVNFNTIEESVLNGNTRLSNTIFIVMKKPFLYESDSEQDEKVFIDFAKKNRYLNISKDGDDIKIENSDKYQYFNISREIIHAYGDEVEIMIDIYARRFFKLNDDDKPKLGFLNFLLKRN